MNLFIRKILFNLSERSTRSIHIQIIVTITIEMKISILIENFDLKDRSKFKRKFLYFRVHIYMYIPHKSTQFLIYHKRNIHECHTAKQ